MTINFEANGSWQPLFLSFVASAVLVPLARHLALRKGIIDVPNERSSHRTPKPRIGGVAIILGAAIGLFLTLTSSEIEGPPQLFTLLIVLLGLAVVGFIDDIRGLPAAVRMSLYLLGAGVVAAACYRLEVLSLWGVALHLNTVLGISATTVFIGWYTNLFNFMDGIDGIASGAAIVTCGSLGVVFARNDEVILSFLALALTGATAGFLLYNYAPSNVFMGDGGSVFLGAACGSLSVAAINRGYLSLTATALLMFPFVYDASFTLIRRALAGNKVWQAHRSHIYQQMCDLGLSHREVTITYTTFAATCAYCGLCFDHWSTFLKWSAGLSILGIVVAGTALVLAMNRRRQAS